MGRGRRPRSLRPEPGSPMPNPSKLRKVRRKTLVRVFRPGPRFEAVLSFLATWNRHQIARIIGAITLAWLIGATALHLAERANPAFKTWGGSLWNVWVLLFSGNVEEPLHSVTGRLVTMVLLGAGVGLAGLFTATVASILVEYHLRRREVANFEMEDHLVLC